MLTVQVEVFHAFLGAVDHVRLHLAVLDAVKGRVRTHRNSGGVTGTRLVHEPAGVHAVRGNQTAGLQLQVCGREAQLTAARQAVHNLAGHHVVAAQQLGRGRHVALQQQLADACRGAAGVLIHHEVLHDHNLEAVLLPQLTHRVQVTRVIATEAHVIANHHVAGVEAIHKGGLHELLWGLLRKLQAVVQQQIVLQTQQAHVVAASALAHDVVVSHLGAVHLNGVRVKRNRDGAQTVLLSEGHHA